MANQVVKFIKGSVSNMKDGKETDKSKFYALVTVSEAKMIGSLPVIDSFNAVFETTKEALDSLEKGHKFEGIGIKKRTKTDELTGAAMDDCISGTSIVKAEVYALAND